jgi:sugar phosphate isomerase/epimerase
VTQSISRRSFLATGMAFAASSTFPKDVRHRLSVSTYPFRDLMRSTRRPEANSNKISLEEFAAALTGKFNVYGIEPWSPHFESLEPEYLQSLRGSFDKATLKVVNIPCDIDVKLCGTADERRTAFIRYQKWVDAAIVLGSPSIRIHCPDGKSVEDTSCAIEGLKQLASYGASKNIVINLENDDPVSENPSRIVKVIKGVNSRYLRSLPDFCNSMLIHNDEDYNAKALSELFPLAYNISHVKDVETADGKTYKVNVGRLFAVAKKANYRGYFSMESEGSGDPYENTKSLIETSMTSLA